MTQPQLLKSALTCFAICAVIIIIITLSGCATPINTPAYGITERLVRLEVNDDCGKSTPAFTRRWVDPIYVCVEPKDFSKIGDMIVWDEFGVHVFNEMTGLPIENSHIIRGGK